MTIRALNRWRVVYLTEALLLAVTRTRGGSLPARATRATLLLGAALWLMHDLAHGRWRIAVSDALALAGGVANRPILTVAAVAWAVLRPERPPSPFVWESGLSAMRGRAAARGAS